MSNSSGVGKSSVMLKKKMSLVNKEQSVTIGEVGIITSKERKMKKKKRKMVMKSKRKNR